MEEGSRVQGSWRYMTIFRQFCMWTPSVIIYKLTSFFNRFVRRNVTRNKRDCINRKFIIDLLSLINYVAISSCKCIRSADTRRRLNRHKMIKISEFWILILIIALLHKKYERNVSFHASMI